MGVLGPQGRDCHWWTEAGELYDTQEARQRSCRQGQEQVITAHQAGKWVGGENHPGTSTHSTWQVGRWRNFPSCWGGQQCQAQQPEGQVSRTLVKPTWKASSSGRWGRAAEVQRTEGSAGLDLGGWTPARMACSERSSSLPGPFPISRLLQE